MVQPWRFQKHPDETNTWGSPGQEAAPEDPQCRSVSDKLVSAQLKAGG